MPMPGSPTNRITAPGTRPPPSTRSSSVIPVGRAATAVVSGSVSGTAANFGRTGAGAARMAPGESDCSCTVPQAWHSGHRPTQRGAVAPHSWQRYVAVGRLFRPLEAAIEVMPESYRKGLTKSGSNLLAGSGDTNLRKNRLTVENPAKLVNLANPGKLSQFLVCRGELFCLSQPQAGWFDHSARRVGEPCYP